MVPDINYYVCSYMKYWTWDTILGKLIIMYLHKYIYWEFPPDVNCWLCNCYTINIVSIQRDIPLFHLIYERVKYPYDTIHTVMSQGQIPLRHFAMREVSIYNHLLINYTSPLTRITTGIKWNIQWWGVYDLIWLDWVRNSNPTAYIGV